MIVGVLGNFMVLGYISMQITIFELLKNQQGECYYKKPSDYLKKDTEGDKCMEVWVKDHSFILYFTDFTGLFVQTLAEVLAILPYVLRSLRI